MGPKPTADELGVNLADLDWRRSGSGSEAFEIAFARGPAVAREGAAAEPAAETGGDAQRNRAEWVLLRVSDDPAGRVLVYDRHEWECFLDGVRRGEFDDGA